MQPGDLKPVPREPTEEMKLAGMEASSLCIKEVWPNGQPRGILRSLDTEQVGELWQAMYDAAPALPPAPTEPWPEISDTYLDALQAQVDRDKPEGFKLTPIPPVPEIEALVTQADREAARGYFERIEATFGYDETMGMYDPLVQAFARHRATALQSQAAECARLRAELSKATGRQRVSIVDQERKEVGHRFVRLEDLLVEEAWVDEDGTAWTPPTAYAYFAACRARQALSQETTKDDV